MLGFDAIASAPIASQSGAAPAVPAIALLPAWTVAGAGGAFELVPIDAVGLFALPALSVAGAIETSVPCMTLQSWERCAVRPSSSFAASGRLGSLRTGEPSGDP